MENSFSEDSDSDNYSNCGNDKINYEKYIISTHDSDTSEENVDLSSTNSLENDTNFTLNQILNTKFDKDDTILFVFGMLNRITGYLNNLTKDKHTKWLTDKIGLMKTVVDRQIHHSQTEDAASSPQHNNTVPQSLSPNLSGSGQISEFTDSKERSKIPSKSASPQKKNRSVLQKSKPQLNDSTSKSILKAPKKKSGPKTNTKIFAKKKAANIDRQDETTSPEINNSNMELKKNSLLNKRFSHRLQELTKDKELVYCDKLTYAALNLPSTKNATIKVIENPFIKRKTAEGKKESKKRDLSKRFSSLTSKEDVKKSVSFEIQQTKNQNSIEIISKPKRGRPKILKEKIDTKNGEQNQVNNTANENEKEKPEKRRASSLEHSPSKKRRFHSHKRNTSYSQSTTSQSNLIRKALYSPEKWLLSFRKEYEDERM